jgi:hypothetical protein
VQAGTPLFHPRRASVNKIQHGNNVMMDVQFFTAPGESWRPETGKKRRKLLQSGARKDEAVKKQHNATSAWEINYSRPEIVQLVFCSY